MKLSIATSHRPATDLGYLLHKHPDKFQSFNLNFGRAHVFYPQASKNECKACLLLDIDPLELARIHRRDAGSMLANYVNDRPFVASSFMSTAIAQVFGSALAGRSSDRENLAATPIPLFVEIDLLPIRGGESFARRIFEPLGYSVELQGYPLDARFPDWGESSYFTVKLQSEQHTLSQMLNHLYVLIPVFDNNKHYYIGSAELEKLLAKGQGWLAQHPEKEAISRRYLKFRKGLVRKALEALNENEDEERAESESDSREQELEKPLSLNAQRHQAVVESLVSSGATSVIDLGCGEGKLLRELLSRKQFTRIHGIDVSIRALETASSRLKIDTMPAKLASRISISQASLMYRDQRFAGFDAAAVVEVIEHLDPARLAAFEKVVFRHARPKTVVLTTPNSEYNAVWDSLPAGEFRHSDHRFEWTRSQFESWCQRINDQYSYEFELSGIGDVHADYGSPTQMAVFQEASS